MIYDTSKGGFVAITSAIIVLAFLLGAVVLIGQSGFSGYADTAGFEAKRTAFHAAEGCLRHALLRLAAGTYSGEETFSAGGVPCEILPIAFGTSTITVRASSTARGSFVNLELVVHGYTLEQISFAEKASF